jgi:hypothetical protein
MAWLRICTGSLFEWASPIQEQLCLPEIPFSSFHQCNIVTLRSKLATISIRQGQAAYWDYQRDRVYARSNRRLRRLSRETLTGHARTEVRPNKIIRVEESRPVSCCHCNGAPIYKWGRFSQTVYDLRSSLVGMKRWVVRSHLPSLQFDFTNTFPF